MLVVGGMSGRVGPTTMLKEILNIHWYCWYISSKNDSFMVLQKKSVFLGKKNNAFWAAEIYNIEKAVFRQALSKLSPNFREKMALYKLHLQNPSIFQSYLTTFAKLSQKEQNTLANSGVNFCQRSFWHTKGHPILHSRQGPLDPHSYPPPFHERDKT